MTSDSTAPGALGTRLSLPLLWLLAACGALGSMAIHMVIPALPAAAASLHANARTMQLAISVYLIGISCGQMVAGPLTDRIGRKPVLLVGALLFVIGSLAAAAAPTAAWLVAARFLQACGGAAGLVATRALVSDLSPFAEVTANVAMLSSVVLLSPMLSPTIGGLLVSLAGWRSIFLLLAGCGVAMAAAIAIAVPSTVRAGTEHALLASYTRLARNRRFRGFVLTNALASSGLYTFLAGSSFILISGFGLSPGKAGLCYLGIAAASISGTFVLRRLPPRRDALRLGLLLMVTGGAGMSLLAIAGVSSVAALVVPMAIVALGAGIVAPIGIAGAMAAEVGLAGTGSSLAGAVQMLASGLATSITGAFVGGSPVGLAVSILGCAVLAFVCAPQPVAT